MIEAIRKAMEPLRQRVALMVGRAVISAVNDARRLQTAQVSLLAGEVLDNVERVQQYGFTSVPQPGAEAVVVFIGGDRGHAVILATDDRRFRLKNLAPGEVAIYTDEGDSIVLRRGGKIAITATSEIVASAPKITCEGDVVIEALANVTVNAPAVAIESPMVTVDGALTVTGAVVAGGPLTAPAATVGGIPFGTHKHTGGTIPPSGMTGGPTP